MSHTKGKLHMGGTINPMGNKPTVNLWSETPQGFQSGNIVAQNVSPPNARRLVACWNALADVSTDDIENSVFIPPEVTYRELEKQRDELLAALERLERVSGQAMMQDDPDRVSARSILAKYPKVES